MRRFLVELPKSIALRISLLLNALAALCLLLAYMAPYISPEGSYWIALLGLGYPFLLITNVLAIIWWLYFRSRLVYISLFAVLLGLKHAFNFVGISGGSPTQPGALKILTYNVHYFNATTVKSNEEGMKQTKWFVEYVQQQGADIFCGQEFSGRAAEHVRYAHEYLTGRTPLKYAHKGGGSNLVIYSRYPIVRTGEISFKHSHNGAIFADIALPSGRQVRVYCMHLQSIQLGADTDEVLSKHNLIHLRDESTREKYKRISSKLKRAFLMRAEQSEALAAHIAQSPHPVVLAGDLNDTPLSYSYARLLGAGLSDSFYERGSGLGTTYAGNLPLLRIDYIMAGAKAFRFYTHRILPQSRSDHYALVCELGLR